jgi:hypothetical protein
MTAKRAAPLHRTLYASEEHTLNIDPEIASVKRNREQLAKSVGRGNAGAAKMQHQDTE